MVQLAKSQLTEKYNLSSLEHAYSGGTKISPEVESTFCAKFGLDKTKLGMTNRINSFEANGNPTFYTLK